MRKLVIITAATILAMFGFANPSVAATLDEDGCADANPNYVDINELEVTAVGGGTDEITVRLELCANPSSRAQYRVHLDYMGDFASDVLGGCVTTSDDTPKRSFRPNGTKDTGPGSISQNGVTLTYVVTYGELGLSGGDPVEIWADTHRKGIKDRSPNTVDEIDGCSKPQEADEVLQITLP